MSTAKEAYLRDLAGRLGERLKRSGEAMGRRMGALQAEKRSCQKQLESAHTELHNYKDRLGTLTRDYLRRVGQRNRAYHHVESLSLDLCEKRALINTLVGQRNRARRQRDQRGVDLENALEDKRARLQRQAQTIKSLQQARTASRKAIHELEDAVIALREVRDRKATALTNVRKKWAEATMERIKAGREVKCLNRVIEKLEQDLLTMASKESK